VLPVFSDDDLGGVICWSFWSFEDNGILSPKSSFFKTVEKVLLASSSLRYSSSDESLELVGILTGSLWLKLKAACRSTPFLLGIYRSL
jgi:hypothetical protein